MDVLGELLVAREVGLGRLDAGLVGRTEGLGDPLDLYFHLGDLWARRVSILVPACQPVEIRSKGKGRGICGNAERTTR